MCWGIVIRANQPFKLSVSEYFLLICAILTLPLVKLLLKQRGFGKTEKFFARLGRKTLSADAPADKVLAAARMVSVAAAHGFYEAQCLEQAITLRWMLHMMGIESTIRLGIYRSDESLGAHAWVLYKDEVVIGKTQRIGDFQPILDVNVNRN